MLREVLIARTWDGVPIPAAEVARAHVDLEPEALFITVDAPFWGDPAPSSAAGSFDGLWDYEVVELFLLGAHGHYTEIELSPHGHHLVLRLEGVRRVVERGLPIEYRAKIAGSRWRGTARVPRAYLPNGPYRGNAYAINGVGPERRYLAMEPVPGTKPDFHRIDQFIPLELLES